MATAKKTNTKQQTTAPVEPKNVRPNERIRKYLDTTVFNKEFYDYKRLIESHPFKKNVDKELAKLQDSKNDTPAAKNEKAKKRAQLVESLYDELLKMEPLPEQEPVEESEQQEEVKVELSLTEREVLKLLKSRKQVHFSSRACSHISAFIHVVVEELLKTGFANTKASEKKTCSLDTLFSDEGNVRSLCYSKTINTRLVPLLEQLPIYIRVKNDLTNLAVSSKLSTELNSIRAAVEKLTVSSKSKKVAELPNRLLELIDFGRYLPAQPTEEVPEPELDADIVPDKYLNDKTTMMFSFFINAMIKTLTAENEEYKSLKKSKPFKTFITTIVEELVSLIGRTIRFTLTVSNVKTINERFTRNVFEELLSDVENSDEILTRVDQLVDEVYEKKKKQ